jgi:hypothetical protein
MRPKILRDQPQDVRTIRRDERRTEGKQQKKTLHGPAACLKVRCKGKKVFQP